MAAPKTFYKYVEREQESRVNWNEVSRDLTTRLKLETEDRELRKEEIKQSTRDLINYQENPPAGLNYTLNQQVQNLSSDLIEATILQQKLLESGDLSERAFKNIRQNMQDDTENIYRVYKGYNDKFAEYAERQQPGSNANGIDPAASWIEAANMQSLEEMHNFKQYAPNVDAGSGSISLLKFDNNGQLIKGAGASVKDYLTRQESKYDWFDLNTAETQEVSRLGLVTSADYVSKLAKGVITLEDAKQNPEFESWLNTATISIMGDETQMSKILGDNMKGIPLDDQGNYDPNGKITPFKVVFDPDMVGEGKGDQYVLGYRDPNGGSPLYKPTTEKQKEVLKDYIQSRLVARLGSKESLTSNQATRSGSTQRKRGLPAYDMVSQISTSISTGESGNDLARYLTDQGIKKKVKNAAGAQLELVSFDEDEYSFNYADGSTEIVTLDFDINSQTVRTLAGKYYSEGVTQAYDGLPSSLKRNLKKGSGTSGKVTVNEMNRANNAYNQEKNRLEKLVASSNEATSADADSQLIDLKADPKKWKENWIVKNPNPYTKFNK